LKLKLFDYEDWKPSTDCCIAAAAIGGAASLAGAGISAFGATTAANDQVKAQQAAIAAQQQMFNVGQQNLQPFIQGGANAIPQLAALSNTSNPNSTLSQLLALTTPGSNQTATLEKTPGFQFLSQYGTMATENAQAAQGAGGPGGNLATAISNYNQGLAGTQYSTIVNSLLGAYGAGTGALQNLANMGANAAGGLASNATAAGQGIASSTAGIGNAQAGAATSIGNSVGSAVGSIGSNLSNMNILSLLSGQGGLFGGGGIYGGGSPGTSIGGAVGPTSFGGANGPAPLVGYGLGA